MTEAMGPALSERELGAVSNLGLAYVGDCVFELLVRTHLLRLGLQTNRSLHAAAVEYTRASGQARCMERLLPLLREEEAAVYRRGRNSHVNSVPKHADLNEYHTATGLECLFGWLYLRGEQERLRELFQTVAEAGRSDDAS